MLVVWGYIGYHCNYRGCQGGSTSNITVSLVLSIDNNLGKLNRIVSKITTFYLY